MSREGFSEFIRALERSSALRRELKNCDNINSVLELSAKYKFKVTFNDLQNDSNLSSIEEWFRESRIDPIRKN